MSGRLDLVKLFVEHGADTEKRNSVGSRASMRLADDHHFDSIFLFILKKIIIKPLPCTFIVYVLYLQQHGHQALDFAQSFGRNVSIGTRIRVPPSAQSDSIGFGYVT